MNTTETKFEQAEQFLESAKKELNRPAEDVVPYMVCKSTHKSIAHFLMGFLLQNNVAFNEEDSVEVLLKKCQNISDKFNNLDLKPITFSKDYEYSTEFNQMQKCIDLANHTKELVH
ncbi:hypothetical protein J1D01_01400 [Seonamhaeicola sp. NFXS20]|uniref:hypothetical protein n=1 Tax=unclassified Seonamhaeicola TaxID=2622645 RepID=UPI003561C288